MSAESSDVTPLPVHSCVTFNSMRSCSVDHIEEQIPRYVIVVSIPHSSPSSASNTSSLTNCSQTLHFTTGSSSVPCLIRNDFSILKPHHVEQFNAGFENTPLLREDGDDITEKNSEDSELYLCDTSTRAQVKFLAHKLQHFIDTSSWNRTLCETVKEAQEDNGYRCKIYLYTVIMDAHLTSSALFSCHHSRTFCQNFLKYLRCHSTSYRVRYCVGKSIEDKTLSTDKRSSVFHVVLQWPQQCKLDMRWFYRLQSLTVRRILLDDAMNWLNTLGGGYSALGDYFEHHALEAGRISFKQLKIAVEMGDLINASKCRLYFSLSLMQRGYLRFAKKLIRSEFAFATSGSIENQDSRLRNMCIGMWSRLQYFYHLPASAKKTTSRDKHANPEDIFNAYKSG